VRECTQDQLVADVEGVRQALGLGRVLVLGISWGGFLGLMYATRYPASVRALAVVGASARGQRPLPARRGARGARPRARRYFPVQRTALSDWYTPANVGIATNPS
jgi:pimeloyl-ACP methyl ester carboxylesterase